MRVSPDGRLPVLRAAAGMSLYGIGRGFFREGRLLNIVSAAAIFFVVLDPEQLFESSFQLSFLAVAVIGAFAIPVLKATSAPLCARTQRNRQPRKGYADAGEIGSVPRRVAAAGSRADSGSRSACARRAFHRDLRGARLPLPMGNFRDDFLHSGGFGFAHDRLFPPSFRLGSYRKRVYCARILPDHSARLPRHRDQLAHARLVMRLASQCRSRGRPLACKLGARVADPRAAVLAGGSLHRGFDCGRPAF